MFININTNIFNIIYKTYCYISIWYNSIDI